MRMPGAPSGGRFWPGHASLRVATSRAHHAGDERGVNLGRSAMMKITTIALGAAVALACAAPSSATAGRGGGFGGGGGFHGGFGGFHGGFGGFHGGFGGFRGGFYGPYFYPRPFYAGLYGSPCWRPVWTPWGFHRRWVCGYPYS